MSICEEGTRKYPDGRRGKVAGFMAHKNAGEAPCGDCREGWNANVMRLRSADPEKRLRQRMVSERGMTLERYEGLADVQGGCCAICGKVPQRLVIDHDHRCCPDGHKRCGECNRSLLCDHCNRGLGHFLDDPALLGAAIEYLKGWSR